jgi:hypothetical protein
LPNTLPAAKRSLFFREEPIDSWEKKRALNRLYEANVRLDAKPAKDIRVRSQHARAWKRMSAFQTPAAAVANFSG